MQYSNSRLLVIGTVAFDSIQTPFGVAERTIGGAATYAALSASYFTKNINLISVVGDDFPTNTLDMLRSNGINLDGLQIKQGEKSFFWSGKYHSDMNTRDSLETQLNVLADFDPVIPPAYQQCDYLMLGNLAPQVQRKVIDGLRHRPKLIVMDTMNFWMEIAMDDLRQNLKMIDVLTINDSEARELGNAYSLVKAAKNIMAMGPRYLVIKKGEHGALLFNEKNVFFAPALPLEDVFDPTGAGDTFAGGFIGHLCQTDDISYENMKRAIIYGSAMASFCVEKFGIERLVELKPNEIEERIQDFIDLVQFDISLVE